jgi:hypothetical protein
VVIVINREKIVARIDTAEAEVRKLRDLLQLFDSIAQEEVDQNKPTVLTVSKINRRVRTPVKAESQKKTRNMELARSIQNTFFETGKEEFTDVPKVVKIVEVKYPKIGRIELTKLVGDIARRLTKKGKLKLEVETAGRGVPKKYKSVS